MQHDSAKGPLQPLDRQVVGSWRLVSATAVDARGTPIALPYGPIPMGQLVLTETNRMMAVLCDGRTSIPAGAERAYSSYCGMYSIEGDRLVTVVDAASDLTRIGSKQVRKIEMRGQCLVLTPPPRADGEQRELIWERIR